LLGARGVGQHLLERIADGGFVGGAVGGELGQAQAVGGNGGDLWVMDRGCSLRLLNVMRGHQAVEGYLEALAAEIANGAWVDIPGVGKVQVSREEGKGYVTSITPRWAAHPPEGADASANQNPPVREVQVEIQIRLLRNYWRATLSQDMLPLLFNDN
jgi:hypothetical protein